MRRPVLAASLLALALAAGVAAGCGRAAQTAGSPSGAVRAAATAATRAETRVDAARIAANLGVLAGKTPAAPGFSIPERGSVDGRALTRRFLTETLQGLGYTVETHGYRQNGQNLIARLPGADAGAPWIIVGAHMDSVRNAGADDNGSGSTAVLEAAATLKDLPGRKLNVMFTWYDEEELGLVGSYAMAKDFKKAGMKVASVHTVDMLGYDGDDDRKVEIERPDGNLWAYYQMVNESHGLKLPLARTNSGDTDHVAWRSEGFPAVGLCEEWVGGDTTPHYHRKTDTYETIDLEFLTAGTRLLVATVGDLARGVAGPAAVRQVPHDQFPGRPRPFHGPGHTHDEL